MPRRELYSSSHGDVLTVEVPEDEDGIVLQWSCPSDPENDAPMNLRIPESACRGLLAFLVNTKKGIR